MGSGKAMSGSPCRRTWTALNREASWRSCEGPALDGTARPRVGDHVSATSPSWDWPDLPGRRRHLRLDVIDEALHSRRHVPCARVHDVDWCRGGLPVAQHAL